MDWVLLGYLMKRRAVRIGWVSPWPQHPNVGFPCGEPVEEICSVSGCISRRARAADGAGEDPLGVFPTAEAALAVVPPEDRAAYGLYAYRLRPVQFVEGVEAPIELWWDPSPEPLGATFERLGCDAVVGGNGHGFGCSPLSCNSGADVVECPELNRYCLVDDPRTATELARRFSIQQPEPGPYCVVEVWREAPPDARS